MPSAPDNCRCRPGGRRPRPAPPGLDRSRRRPGRRARAGHRRRLSGGRDAPDPVVGAVGDQDRPVGGRGDTADRAQRDRRPPAVVAVEAQTPLVPTTTRGPPPLPAQTIRPRHRRGRSRRRPRHRRARRAGVAAGLDRVRTVERWCRPGRSDAMDRLLASATRTSPDESTATPLVLLQQRRPGRPAVAAGAGRPGPGINCGGADPRDREHLVQRPASATSRYPSAARARARGSRRSRRPGCGSPRTRRPAG